MKKGWILALFIFAGLVIGGLLGNLAGNVDFLWWLSYGKDFGLSQPLVLDINVLTITFGFMCHINVASIIGLFVALFAYRKFC